MSDTIPIDQAGRVVLPKHLRERFRLRGGDTLSVEVRDDAIELRPTKSSVRFQRVNGVLVLTGKTSLPEGRDLVAQTRDDRLDELARNAKGGK